jgi:hypothetical protein
MISLIKKEISGKRMDAEILKFILSAFQYDHNCLNIPWSLDLENQFYIVIREWNIKLYNSKKKPIPINYSSKN